MGVDNVMSCMVTVADVEVSGDLQVVKVFVSILGDERGKKNAINGLKKMEGYVRRNIGKRVSLRLTPDIRFVYDDSFERGQRVSSLLDELRVEREVRKRVAVDTPSPSFSPSRTPSQTLTAMTRIAIGLRISMSSLGRRRRRRRRRTRILTSRQFGMSYKRMPKLTTECAPGGCRAISVP